MKIGDLVVMPNAVDYTIRKKCGTVGLIINDTIVRKRIGVMLSDGSGEVDYEPVAWLKVINESR